MEEILASIRRIIADDNPDAVKAAASQAAPAKPVPSAPSPNSPAPMSQDDIDAMLADQAEEEADVLELSDPVHPARAEPAPMPESGFRQVPASDVMFREEPVRDSAPVQQPHTPQATAGADALLSAETNAAVSAAFGSLATTILSQNSRTIEDLVREMLRPMLKAWLDDNLQGLVERMVRAEIERVSRGGR